MRSESVFLNQKSVFFAGAGRRKRFALLDVATLEDKNLSWKSKGIWATLISRTDDWKTRVTWLANIGPDGTKAVRSGLQELEAAGYILSRQRVGDDGRFLPYEYLILAARADIILNDSFIKEWKTKPASSSDAHEDEGGIIRVDPALQRRFAQIDQEALVSSISFRAKGIWAYLMSRPETWEVTIQELLKASRDGRISNAAGINELIDAEYIAKKQDRDAAGKYLPLEYFFFERPFSELVAAQKEVEELFLNKKGEKVILQSPLSQNLLADVSPLSQNLLADVSPLSQNLLADTNSPLSQNLLADTKNEQAIDLIKDNPQTGFRQAVKRQTENAPILRTKTTYYDSNVSQSSPDKFSSIEKSLQQNLVSQDQTNQTNHNKYLSMDEFWDIAGALDLSGFIKALSTEFKMAWPNYQQDILHEMFSPMDSRRHRVWLLEKLFRLIRKQHSAAGILDMIQHDIISGTHPPIYQTQLAPSVSVEPDSDDFDELNPLDSKRFDPLDSKRIIELKAFGIEAKTAVKLAASEDNFQVSRTSELQSNGLSFEAAFEIALKELARLKVLNVVRQSICDESKTTLITQLIAAGYSQFEASDIVNSNASENKSAGLEH